MAKFAWFKSFKKDPCFDRVKNIGLYLHKGFVELSGLRALDYIRKKHTLEENFIKLGLDIIKSKNELKVNNIKDIL